MLEDLLPGPSQSCMGLLEEAGLFTMNLSVRQELLAAGARGRVGGGGGISGKEPLRAKRRHEASGLGREQQEALVRRV